MSRFLIVNADDFGLSAGVNRGIIESAGRGIVTSASLMVRWPAAAEAAAYARANPAFSVGLHLDLGEWRWRAGAWELLYRVVEPEDAGAVAGEVRRQLTEFRRLAARDPSHLDSHQHVHRQEPARSILLALARELGVPLREASPGIHYCGDFYGQDGEGRPLPGVISVENLGRILLALKEPVTELGCHPGYGDDLTSPYRSERAEEVRVLCDPKARVAAAAAGLTLRGFRQ